MARIVVQMGHVPRTSGATGTHREQEFTKALAPRIKARAERLGHVVHVIGADAGIPRCDYFVSLHLDGSADRRRRGASVGYPDSRGGLAAGQWKLEHKAAGYDGGFLADNYTAGLRSYYAYPAAGRAGARYRFLAEHGTATNPTDERLLFAKLDAWADAHVATIGAIVGHPKPPPVTPTPGDPMLVRTAAMRAVEGGGVLVAGPDGGVFTFYGAPYLGSLPEQGIKPNAPIVAIVPVGRTGYFLVGADGGVFGFGNAGPTLDEVDVYEPLVNEYPAIRIVDADRDGQALVLAAENIDASNEGGLYRLALS